ncbi:heavy-metal-associated domain-containing protein [Catellatospora methionotrophica]|uniref:heavy-metal-associated domain-containing protein n=1 Tax=Catellatospora methionotrophica TaxID=121620 RepID=UPI0033EA7F13
MNMEFGVEGMTCHKCVDVRSARCPGVDGVEIDFDAAALRVVSAEPVDRELVDAAIVEAGFTGR